MAAIAEPPHFAIFDCIMEWGEEQEDTINWAWLSPGGWEGWAQVELHRAFDYHATREDHAYEHPPGSQGKRSDLAFNDGPFLVSDPDSDHPHENILLELKCESAKNRLKFKEGVRKDLEKIQGDVKEEWWIEGGCTIYAISLSMSQSGHSEMASLGMRNFNVYSEHNPPFQLWWEIRQLRPNHFVNEDGPDFDLDRAAVYTEIDNGYDNAPVSYGEDEVWTSNDQSNTQDEEDSNMDENEDSEDSEPEDSEGDNSEEANVFGDDDRDDGVLDYFEGTQEDFEESQSTTWVSDVEDTEDEEIEGAYAFAEAGDDYRADYDDEEEFSDDDEDRRAMIAQIRATYHGL